MSRWRAQRRLLLRDRALWAVFAVALATSGAASLNGRDWQQRREAVAATEPTSLAEVLARRDELPAQGRPPASDPERQALNAFGVAFEGHYTALPAGPLAGVAIGLTDSEPITGKISLWTLRHALFPDVEPINPAHVAIGQFDPAFLVVFLMPLLLIAVGYDLVAREREAGTLTLLRAQPTRLRGILWPRMVVKAGVVALPMVLLPLFGVAGEQFTSVSPFELLLLVAGWSSAVIAYAAFWMWAAVLVNARERGSVANALVLVTLWLASTVALPQAGSVVVETLAPAPSRLAYIKALRAAQTRAEGDVSPIRARFAMARPETQPKAGQQGFIAPYFLQMWSIAADMRPDLEAIDLVRARRESLADRLWLLSPSLVTYDILTELAGSGARDVRWLQERTVRQHEAWHRYFAPPAFLRRPMTAAMYEGIPRPESPTRPLSGRFRRVVVDVTVLTLFAGITAWLAMGSWGRERLG